MTFKEKLKQEHPEMINPHFIGGCQGCPWGYGYEEKHECKVDCEKCWNREMPTSKVTLEIVCEGIQEAENALKKALDAVNEFVGQMKGSELHVGDEIKSFSNGSKAIVTWISEEKDRICIMWGDGSGGFRETEKFKFEKTGRHFDIQSILDQIGGGQYEKKL